MKNKNKKLPRYNIGTSVTRGYQRNKGIGAASFSSNPGENLMSDVNAMRQSQIPKAIGNLTQGMSYPLQALQNLSPITSITGASAINNAGGFSNLVSKGATPFVSGVDKVSGLPTEIGLKAAKGSNFGMALNTAGKITAGLGTAYGAYNVMNDIMHAGDTITTGQIANTRGTNIITTAGGNTYTEKTGPNASAVKAYEDQARASKQIGLAVDAISLGSSLGSFGGPLGMGIGAGIGALLGGVGALFGFGDNEEEVNNRLKLIQDVTNMENRQSEGLAKNQDTRDAFYEKAANGKMPGFSNGKANARVSNGEIVGNFKDGYFRVPGSKNNKDTVKTHLGKKDFVISNKHGLSDYAWLTGDIPGALAAQSYLQKTGQMNKYKDGKLPKYKLGTVGDYAISIAPHFSSLASNLTQLLRAQNSDIYAPDLYVDNPEGARALNTLASLRFDADPYYREAQRGLNQANWETRRLVGLGTGGRAVMLNSNYRQYLNGLRDISKMYNEAQNGYREKYANALANLGATNQGRRMQANAQRHQFLQQANAAKENWMAQYRKNIDTNLLNAASEYMKMGQYNDALGIQNKMLGLYDRQIANDELKANAYINSLGRNKTQTNTSAGIPLSYTTSMAKTPLSIYGFTAPYMINLLNKTPKINMP